jgi:FMN-dependent NADH-azoreductase
MEAPYVERWLNFLGVTDIKSIIIEPTNLGELQASEARERANAEARAVAGAF